MWYHFNVGLAARRLLYFLSVWTPLQGCALEFGGNHDDAGSSDDVNLCCMECALSNDHCYPAGPYGTNVGDRIENLKLEECVCSNESIEGTPLQLADLLGFRAILISIHGGACPNCEAQAVTMESDLYQPYKEKGLAIVLILYEDDQHNTSREKVLEFCCQYQTDYRMTFFVTVDPAARQVIDYFDSTPLNMILDQEMTIRYKEQGAQTELLELNMQNLLGEESLP